MALTALQLKPGVNKEITNYANKGGWVDADKVRFRQGYPEKIGGWQRISAQTFQGVCRSLWEWSTLGGAALTGVGTHLKYYVERGGLYFDITPLRATTAPGGVSFSASNGSSILTVNDPLHGARAGDFVTFSGAVGLGGTVTAAVLNREHRVLGITNNGVYTVQLAASATAADTGNGGAAVVGAYQIATGAAGAQAVSGWGANTWGTGSWGQGAAGTLPLRLWSHASYGEDLIYGPRGGALYYWDSSAGVAARGVLVTGSAVPLAHNLLLVSDISRFVLVFGCNDLGQTELDPMLIRWSNQEDYTAWQPAITNQAGGIRLSAGSRIVAARQSRQEILVWTDTALYAGQYQGPPFVWGFQLMGENVSVAGPAATASANNTAFWMGVDKFYRYDGRVQTLRCDVRRDVFLRYDPARGDEVVCGTNEAFNEVWWFYPARGQANVNDYVVYNYAEDTWYPGKMHRTAWLDSALRGVPIAAWQDRVVQHEVGFDDASGSEPLPITAFIESADVDIASGDRASFVWRVLPDVAFAGSSAVQPQVLLTLKPRAAAGAPYRQPGSVGGDAAQAVTRTATVPVEQFTEQVDIRVRGRQVAMRIESSGLGVAWQLGQPRVDLRPDGRRG